MNDFNKLIAEKKNYVFIGETGSGKTECALNLSVYLAGITGKEIHYFDLDQTKPLFRGRDAEALLCANGVKMHYMDQILDSPTVVSGIESSLENDSFIVILDIGGGSHGVDTIGQFNSILNKNNTEIFYIVNPYRSWSSVRSDIEETLSGIMMHSRLNSCSFVANPNYGPKTSFDDIKDGLKKCDELLYPNKICFVCAMESMCNELSSLTDKFILPIRLMTLPGWMLI